MVTAVVVVVAGVVVVVVAVVVGGVGGVGGGGVVGGVAAASSGHQRYRGSPRWRRGRRRAMGVPWTTASASTCSWATFSSASRARDTCCCRWSAPPRCTTTSATRGRHTATLLCRRPSRVWAGAMRRSFCGRGPSTMARPSRGSHARCACLGCAASARCAGRCGRARRRASRPRWGRHTLRLCCSRRPWSCPQLGPGRKGIFSNRVGMNIPPSGLAVLDPEGVDG